MPRIADWQSLPNSVLETQRRDEEAASWADRQRRTVAQQWGDMHRQDFEQATASLIAPQPTMPMDPGSPDASGVPMGSFAAPHLPDPYEQPAFDPNNPDRPEDMGLVSQYQTPAGETGGWAGPIPTNTAGQPVREYDQTDPARPQGLAPADGFGPLAPLAPLVRVNLTDEQPLISSIRQHGQDTIHRVDDSGVAGRQVLESRMRGEEPPRDLLDRSTAFTDELALSMSGEPVANAGRTAAGRAGAPLLERVKRLFGTTQVPQESGFLLSDGSFLRGPLDNTGINHGRVREAFGPDTGEHTAVERVVGDGHARFRFDPEDGVSLDVAQALTPQQRSALDRVLKDHGPTTVSVDIRDPATGGFRATRTLGNVRSAATVERAIGAEVGTATPLLERAGSGVRDLAEGARSRFLPEGGAPSGIAAGQRRMFHGTGSAFERPTADKFDAKGLFGPGYYLTSDPRVAGSYASVRRQNVGTWADIDANRTSAKYYRENGNPRYADTLDRRADEAEAALPITAGPNTRAVDVPEGLKLFDADAPIDAALAEQADRFLGQSPGFHTRMLGEELYSRLADEFESFLPVHKAKREANTWLQERGFDGIRYEGGKRIPLADDAGKPIEHTAVVVFPESLPKITNAISGTPGGAVSRNPLSGLRAPKAANLAGAAAGVTGAEATNDPEMPLSQRLLRDAAGFAAGATGVHLARGGRLPDVTGKVGAVTGAPKSAAQDVDRMLSVPGKVERGSATGAKAITLTPAEEVARLRLDKAPEAVRPFIQEAATSGEFWRTQRRNVITDAQAERMADNLGRTVDQVIAKGKAGKSYNAEETRAIRNAVVAQGITAADIAETIKKAGPAGVTDTMLAEQMAAGAKLVDLSRVAEGARAEAGRTFRAYQTMARDFAADPAGATGRIIKAVGGRDEAIKAVTEFQGMVANGADPFQMASFWARTEKPPVGVSDWWRTLRYNAMLSGPRTALVNIVGNAAEIPWRLARDVPASVLTGNARELGPEMAGIASGALKGLHAFGEVLAHGVTLEAATRGDVPTSISSRIRGSGPVATVGRGAALALEAPGRVLQGTDEFFQQLVHGMAIGRSAGRQATQEGLKGAAWAQRVDELSANPTTGMLQGAAAVAERATFHGEMGFLGEKALAPLQRWTPYGVPVGNVVMPFLRTVYHILARGVDRSPLGALGTAADVARGVYGKNLGEVKKAFGATVGPGGGNAPLGERFGDAVLGTMGMGLALLHASQGGLSGAGPDDPEKKAMLRAQGWQPYSVRVGDKWISYANWGPMAVPLSGAAAIVEAQAYRKASDTDLQMYEDMFRRGSEVLTEQAYLQGVGAIVKARQDPERYGDQWLEQTIQTFVPFGAAINTVGQATDPLTRKPEKGDLAGSLRARIPGLREGEPAAQDQLGRPIPNELHGANAVVPLRQSTERPDSVLKALATYQVDVSKPPNTVSAGNLHDVALTESDKREYQRVMGEQLSKRVQAYLDGENVDRHTAKQRQEVLQKRLADAREIAAVAVIDKMGREEARRRAAGARDTKARQLQLTAP